MTIKREKITWPGARIKKKGEGLPQHEQNTITGDLYVTIDVDFPKGELNDQQREGQSLTSNLFSMQILSHSRSTKSIQSRIETSIIQWFIVLENHAIFFFSCSKSV